MQLQSQDLGKPVPLTGLELRAPGPLPYDLSPFQRDRTYICGRNWPFG